MRWKRKGRIITEKEKKPEVPSGKRAKRDELRGEMEKKSNGRDQKMCKRQRVGSREGGRASGL